MAKLPRRRHVNDSVAMIAKPCDGDPHLAEHAERRVIVHVADRRREDAGAQRLDQVLDVRANDAQDALEPCRLRSTDLMVEVERARDQLLADSARLFGER
jgi:hypothetical protein